MHDTNYSLGPKFFGTSTKSTSSPIQSPGSMREIAALPVLALINLNGSIKPLLPTGLSVKTPRGTVFWINTTGNTRRQIAIRWFQWTRLMYFSSNAA